MHAGSVARLIELRLRHFQRNGDASGCRETAEMREGLGRTDAGSLYDAACSRAVTAAVLRAAGAGEEAARSADEEADRAIGWLGKALAAGYGDFAHMEKDADLDVLRDREDFRSLLAGASRGR